MKFNTNMSTNLFDGSMQRKDGRGVLNFGVQKRCELVLQSLLRGRGSKSFDDVFNTLQQISNNAYSVSDIKYAIERLQREELVRVVTKSSKTAKYMASPKALQYFKMITK